MRQLDEAIARCKVDESLERTVIDGFAFPLGAYPVEPVKPVAGYTLAFEPADGDDGPDGPEHDDAVGDAAESGWREREDDDDAMGGLAPDGPAGELEEWPDRYVFDILVPASRVEPLCRALFSLLPGRIYPILDVLGHDEYREVDPYVSYELLGVDRFTDAIRRYRGFFFEDGLVGFGAMSEEPFLYVFVDEHKIVTVRAEVPQRERVEQVLAAFDLKQIEELHGADSVTHEHRGVLEARDDRLDLLIADEIVEELQEQWRLELNVNPDVNVDEEGRELGITGWRCFVRVDPPPEWIGGDEESPTNGESKEGAPRGRRVTVVEPAPSRYAEVLVTADGLTTAQELAVQAVIDLLEHEPAAKTLDGKPEEHSFVVVSSDRMRPASFSDVVEKVKKSPVKLDAMRVCHAAWAS